MEWAEIGEGIGLVLTGILGALGVDQARRLRKSKDTEGGSEEADVMAVLTDLTAKLDSIANKQVGSDKRLEKLQVAQARREEHEDAVLRELRSLRETVRDAMGRTDAALGRAIDALVQRRDG